MPDKNAAARHFVVHDHNAKEGINSKGKQTLQPPYEITAVSLSLSVSRSEDRRLAQKELPQPTAGFQQTSQHTRKMQVADFFCCMHTKFTF